MMPEVVAAGSVTALDIFVESIAFGLSHLELMGELAAAAGLALRTHVEQLTCMRSVPVALAAGARSVDHLSMIHPDDIAPAGRGGLRGGAAARRGVPGRRAPGPGAGDHRRGRHLRAGHRRQSRDLAGVLDAGGHRPGVAPVRPRRPRGARARRRSTRRGRLTCTTTAARSRWASARTSWSSTGRRRASPTASATTRWRSSSSAARSAYVRDDAAAERISGCMTRLGAHPGDGQRALARVPARPARRRRAAAVPAMTSGAGAPRCTGWPRATPRRRWARSAVASTARWRRRATARSASFTTSSTSPTARRTPSPTRWRSRWRRRRARPAWRSRCCPPPITAAVAGIRAARRPGQVRFCDPSVEAFLARVDALRAWADGVDGVSVGVAAHSVRAVPAEWLEEIARYADEHGLVRHVHASEQRRELAECEAEHGCSPIELLDADRLPRAAHQRRARHPRLRARRRAAGRV